MARQTTDDSKERKEWSEQQTIHTPVVSAERARQGVTGHNVRYVLSFGLIAVVVGFLVLYLLIFHFG